MRKVQGSDLELEGVAFLLNDRLEHLVTHDRHDPLIVKLFRRGIRGPGFGFQVQGFGFRVLAFWISVESLGFRIKGVGSGLAFWISVESLGFRIKGVGSGFRCHGSRCAVHDSEFKVRDAGSMGWGIGKLCWNHTRQEITQAPRVEG